MDNISFKKNLNHNPKKVASYFFFDNGFAEISQTQEITAISAHDIYFITL